MYEEYYGFLQSPFSLTPDPRFLYRSESHDIALQQVWQAIRRKEGFIVLTGDIGTGKTTLCRTILEQVDPTTFTALILNPFVTVAELLREVLLSFGIASKEALRSGRLSAASKHELIRALHEFLLTLVPLRGSAVLIIDEAQHLSPEVLEEIRILSNLETNERKLLQIVLVGQLNLLDVLHDAKLRQLDQRISIRCLLMPLNREEVEAYITHRLWVARGSTAVTFTPPAIDRVHALSGGVPRMINLICDRALMFGCEEQTDKIGDQFVVNASSALGLTMPAGVQRRDRVRRAAARTVRIAAASLIIVLVPLAGYVVYAFGNPLRMLNDVAPGVRGAPAMSMPLAAVAPAPPGSVPDLRPPPPGSGFFSVFVAVFRDPRDAARAERVLRTQNLPLFAIDLPGQDGQMQRRLFAGRFPSRAVATTAQQKVASIFPSARVTTVFEERQP